MKKLTLSIAAASALLFSAVPALAQSDAWTIDPSHSSVTFNVRHMLISNVTGQFKNVSGTVMYDGKDLNKAAVQAVVNANSVDTNIKARDEHLRGSVFDVAQFPQITFRSRQVEPEGNGRFKIIGTLTMHGISKDVTLDADPLSPIVRDAKNEEHTSTAASVELDRRDFGITVDKAIDHGGAIVGENVKVTLNIALVKPATR